MAITLIKGGVIGTIDNQRRIFNPGGIAIEGNKIVAVGPLDEIEKNYPVKTVISAQHKVIIPGFVCTHTHMPSVLGHNMPVDFSQFHSFMDLLTKWWWPQIEDMTTHDDIYWSSLFASMKMLRTGTTTIADMVEGPNALPGCLDASAKAAKE